jgi:hypothetical protein
VYHKLKHDTAKDKKASGSSTAKNQFFLLSFFCVKKGEQA